MKQAEEVGRPKITCLVLVYDLPIVSIFVHVIGTFAHKATYVWTR